MEGLNAKEREKLINRIISSNEETRLYVIKIAPIGIVIEMALEEHNYYFLNKIIERLEAEKDTEEAKNNLHRLAKSNAWKIRKFTASIAPIGIVIEMALSENSDYVLENIIERLNAEKDTEEVKNNLYRLAKSNAWKIRKFTASIAPIGIVIEMALENHNYDFLDNIIERLEAEKDTEEVKNNLYKLIKSYAWGIRKFALNVAPLKTLEEIVMSNEDKIVINAIRQILQ